MYDTERLKHLIGEASFDGWVENDGPNCDGFEEHTQLLKESRAQEIIKECLDDLLRGQPELSPQTLRWLKRWWGFDVESAKTEQCSIGTKILSIHKEPIEKSEGKTQ